MLDSPSELVTDIAEAQTRAAAHANLYLLHTVRQELPILEWKKSRSA
jgi:hypothetical protein